MCTLCCAAIRRGDPQTKIAILIAASCHRGTTKAELVEKFGPEIAEQECTVIPEGISTIVR